MLCAIGCPYRKQVMIGVLESAAATDSDESRIALFRQDHDTPFMNTIFTSPVFLDILTILCGSGSIAGFS
jgi:hypothetical protein